MKQKDIALLSKRYQKLLLLLFFATPLSYGLIWYLFYNGSIPLSLLNRHGFTIFGEITATMCILGFLATMIKGGIIMYGIAVLRRLFNQYEQNHFFTGETVTCFARLSSTLIYWVLATVVSDPLLSIILTMNNPAGQKAIAISFQSADLTALVVGGALSIIARVMDSGRKLQEEADLTV